MAQPSTPHTSNMTKLHSFVSSHKLGTVLAVGIAIRLILMPISAHPFDGYVWYSLSESILENGPLALQSFPPLWYHYSLVPVAYSYSWLAGIFGSGTIPMSSLPPALNFYPNFHILAVPGLLFNSIVKIPFLLSDIAIAVILFKTVRELTNKNGLAETAAILWFLNPFVIWISAGWGMWDTIAAMFSIATLYLIIKKKFAYAGVSLSLGIATKLYPALFIIPLLIYLLKLNSNRWRNSVRFFAPFIVTSVLLFLPYIGTITNFFTNFFLPGAAVSGSSTDPIDNPLGFGLTYWSLYGLTRVVNLSISSEFIYFASISTIVLVIAALAFVYWKIGKMCFRHPAYDLTLAMLLPVSALFLFYRFICEQWFIWAIPFLVILLVGGRIKKVYFWGVSIVALLYSLLNCPFPFFFLPLVPWCDSALLAAINIIWRIESFRIITLAILGCIFSILLLIILLQVSYRFPNPSPIFKRHICIAKLSAKCKLLFGPTQFDEEEKIKNNP